MNYMSTEKAAQMWQVTPRRVRQWCTEHKIPGIRLIGKSWQIPENAERPADMRTKTGKEKATHIDRIHLVANVTYPEKTSAPLNEYDLELCRIYDLFLRGYLDKAYDEICAFISQCKDEDYLIPAHIIRINFAVYLEEKSVSVLLSSQKVILAASIKKYPVTSILVDIFLKKTSKTLPYESIPQEALPLLFFRNEHQRFHQIFKTSHLATETALELNCKFLESAGNDVITTYYHCDLATYYQYANNMTLYEYHKKKALEQILKHQWYLILSEYLFCITWDYAQYVDEQTAVFIQNLDERIIHFFAKKYPEIPSIASRMNLDERLLIRIAFQLACKHTNVEISDINNISLFAAKKYINAIHEIVGSSKRSDITNYVLPKLSEI